MSKAVYAQSNALAQKGTSQANQMKEQLQSSNQDNQVVSGDSSILSGNNLQCQNQVNSNDFNTNRSCRSDSGENLNVPPLTIGRPNLYVKVGVDLDNDICQYCSGAAVTISDKDGFDTFDAYLSRGETFHITPYSKYIINVIPINFEGKYTTKFSDDHNNCIRINMTACLGVMDQSYEIQQVDIYLQNRYLPEDQIG